MADQNSVLDQGLDPLQRLRKLRRTTVLGLIVGALFLLLAASALINRSVQQDVEQLETTYTAMQNELLRLQTPAPAVLALQETLTTTRALAEEITAAAPPAAVPWAETVAALERYDPNRLVLTSLTQANGRITLTGQAADDEAVVAYTRAIEANELFAAVVVQSLRVVPAPTATALPAATTTTTPEAAPQPAQPTLPPFLATATTLADFVIYVELDQ